MQLPCSNAVLEIALLQPHHNESVEHINANYATSEISEHRTGDTALNQRHNESTESVLTITWQSELFRVNGLVIYVIKS